MDHLQIIQADNTVIGPDGRLTTIKPTDFTAVDKRGTHWLLYSPFPKQIAFHQSDVTRLVAIGSRGSGKAIHPLTPIPTPTGFTTMAELKVGDDVFDETGLPCRVAWKSCLHTDDWGTFKVTFDDRSSIICGGHHEWFTRSKTEKDGSVKTTTEIAATLKIQSGRETNHRVPLAGAWNTTEKPLPIDPYTLGVWLGDGSSNSGQITTADPFIIEQINNAGYTTKKLKAKYLYSVDGLTAQLRQLDSQEVVRSSRGQCVSCGLERWITARSLCDRCYSNPTIRTSYPKAHKGFKRFIGGVLQSKRIPTLYLTASKAQRLAILQGLMDTDGYCSTTGNVEFCNTNKDLAEGVYQLAASLGLKPGWAEGRATFNGKDCGQKYRVTWTAILDVFRLPRKVGRLPKLTRKTQSLRYITSVERIADTELQCIQVDSPSHQYLVGHNSIPTHNSLALRMDAHMRALTTPGINLVLIRKTYKDLRQTHLVNIPREMEIIGGKFHQTDYIATYPNGSRLFFSYVGHENDALNLLGAEFAAAYFDEISVIPWEFFQQLSASVRVTRGSGIKAVIRAATNPLGASAAEVNKYFVTKDVDPEEDQDYIPDEWGHIRLDMHDNPYLDVEQYRKLFSGFPAHIKKAWLDGEFSDEDALFDFHPNKDHKPWHVIDDLDRKEIIKHARIYRCYDHGYSPDPAYCLWIAHLGNRYIAIHEKIWFKTIVSDIAASIKEEDEKLGLRDAETGYSRIAATMCDPTIDIHTGTDVRTIKGIFELHGIPMDCSVNSREMFASHVHTALAETCHASDHTEVPRLQIYRGNSFMGCPYLIKALPLMRYDERKPLALANHKHDHPIVSLAYFLINLSADEQRSPSSVKSLKPWMRPKKQDRYVLGSKNVRSHSLI